MLEVLRIIRDNPGARASALAPLMYPNTEHLSHRPVKGVFRPALKVAQYLRFLKNRGLVKIRYSGNPMKERTHVIYYVSEVGFEALQNEDRAGRVCPDKDLAGWP